MPLADDHVGRAVLRDAEEEVVGHLAAVVEHGDAARRVERRSRGGSATNAMSRSAKAATQRARRVRGRRDRGPERHDERDLAVVAHAARGEVVVQQQRGLARRRRALERRAADADDRAALRERRAAPRAAARRRRRSRTRCRPRRGPASRRGRSRRRAPRRGRRPRGRRASVVTRRASGSIAVIVSCRKRTPGLTMSRYGEADRVGRRPAEHHVELRVAEDERVALVDQRDVDVVAERLRQHVVSSRTSEASLPERRPASSRPTIDWDSASPRGSR